MDLLNREELERKLARIVGRDLRRELDKLLAYLGDPLNGGMMLIPQWSERLKR